MEKQELRNNLKELKIAWKWFCCGLRWLSIIVFGVLFFLGIYFKLPWKLLAALAVIPIVGLFFPRKVQPWIWLSITVLLLAFFGWVHLPENNSQQWRPYQFDHKVTALESQMAVTGPNAADLYEQVLNEYGETIFYFRFADNQDRRTLVQPWNPAENLRLDFWITALQPALDKLIEASQIDQCRFSIPGNIPAVDPQLKRLNRLKGWARLLLRASMRDLYNNLDQQALQKQLAVIGIARHLYQQKTLMDQSAAFDIELLGARALEYFTVTTADREALSRIEQAFMDLNPRWPGNWPDILVREKILSKNLLGLFYETNDNGDIRYSHSAMMALQEGLGFRPRRLFINQHTMNRLAVIGFFFWLPSNPGGLADMVDKRFDHYSLQVQKGTQFPRYDLRYIWVLGLNIQSFIDWMAMQKVGFYWALDGQFTRHNALRNRHTVFLLLRQFHMEHNRWPDRLDELEHPDAAYILTDPVNGKPWRYERTADGFSLYSLGPNAEDDRGVNDTVKEMDDVRIWPQETE